MRSLTRSTTAAAACVLAVGVALAACGSDSPSDSGGDTTQAAVTTESGDSGNSDVALAFELPTTPMSDADAAALPPLNPAEDPAAPGGTESPGYLYGVWDPARGVQLSTIGLADVAGDRAMTTDDSFRMGSITKTFTATAVLLLVDDGLVDLDEPIATYTGDLTAALPGGDTVTVRQALGMMSGWPEYTNDPAGPYGQLVIEPTRELTAEDLVAAAASQPPTTAGEFAYVNTNYIVLGDLIEQVSGMSYSEFIQQRILDPIGLENTTIPDQTVTAETTSHGYLNDGWFEFDDSAPEAAAIRAAGGTGTDVTDFSTSAAGTAGNGVSTLSDLATWAAADFGNVLLSDSSRAARLEGIPSDKVLAGSTYGLGLLMLGDWHFHGGEIYGWESQLMSNPTTGQVGVVNANACCGLVATNYLYVAESFPDDPDMQALATTVIASITGG